MRNPARNSRVSA